MAACWHFSADKGDKLFELHTGRAGMGPPITYRVDGKQYVALMGRLGRPEAAAPPPPFGAPPPPPPTDLHK
jgi:hypothetical protein